MKDAAILKERAHNLWVSFARKVEPIAQATYIEAAPEFDLARIGGLEGPKEEILTYACAATNPEIYERWGTYPPSGLLLIGKQGVGKALLTRALASLANTPFVSVVVPRLVVEVIHRGGKVGELLQGWSEVLSEMPPLTVLFEELEFS
jgi:transitional endoplasmic reticulum ATPase